MPPVAADLLPRVPLLDRLHHPEELALRVEEAADCVKSVAKAHPEPQFSGPLEASVESLYGVWAALRAMSALMSADRIEAASERERSLHALLRRLGELLEALTRRSDGVARTMEEQLRALADASRLERHEERAQRIEAVARVVHQTARGLREEAAGAAQRVAGERRELDESRSRLAEAHCAALLKGLPGVVSRADLEGHLRELLSRPGLVRSSLCVALVAADGLGEISSSLGAFTADALFFQVGRLVQAMASRRGEALVGLYGEWALGVVLPSCTLAKGRQILEELSARVRRTAWECKAGGHKEVITISVTTALTQPRYGEAVEGLKARLEGLLGRAREGNDGLAIAR